MGEIKIPILPLEKQEHIIKLIENAYFKKEQNKEEAQKLLDSIDDYFLNELGIKMPELEDKMCFVINAQKVKNKRINPYYYQPKFKELEKALEKGNFKIEKLENFITKIHYGISIKNIYVSDGIPILRILN